MREVATILVILAMTACGGAAFQSGGAAEGNDAGDGGARDAVADSSGDSAPKTDGCTPRSTNGYVECFPGDTVTPDMGCLLDQAGDGGVQFGGDFRLPFVCSQCTETFTCDCVVGALNPCGQHPAYPYVTACRVDGLGNMYVTCGAQ